MAGDRVNVVFEYVKGSLLGGRFYTAYELKDLPRVQKENDHPESNTKIVAANVTDEQAQTLCHEALLHSGVIPHRLASLIADPDVPQERVDMEASTLLFAVRFGTPGEDPESKKAS